MDSNPLTDIADKAKQQYLYDNLKEINAGIHQILKEKQSMSCLIELTTGSDAKILVNPEHIISVIPAADQRTWVNMLGGEQYKVLETKDEILKLVSGNATSKYIG